MVRNLLLFSACLFVLTKTSIGQPVQVNLHINPPYPIHLEEYLQLSNQAVVTLTNTSARVLNIKLVPRVSGDKGISARVKDSWQPATPITLSAFETKVLFGSDLDIHFSNLTENDIDVSGVNIDQIIKTESLSEGSYEVCVKALEVSTNDPVSVNPGCTFIYITHYDPPVLLQPTDGEKVIALSPQVVHFTWTPTGIGGVTRYRIQLVDMTESGLFNPNDAFGPNIYVQPYFEIFDLFGTTYPYTLQDPPLQSGHKYAVRIQAYDPSGKLAFKNNGYSEVSTFVYGSLPLLQPQDTTSKPPQIPGNITVAPPQVIYSMDVCQNLPPIANNSPIQGQGSIGVGDVLEIGGHHLTLTEVTWNGNKISGKGKITDVWFGIPILVEFSDLKINSDHVVIDGKAIARDENNAPQEWINEMGNITFGEQEVQNAMQKLLGESDKRIVEWPNTRSIAVGMPVGIERQVGNQSVLIAIVGMHFGPRGAGLNAVMSIDIPTEGQKIILGASGVCFDKGGLTGTVALWLANPLTIGQGKPLSLELLPGNLGTPPQGTHAILENKGFKELHLSGKIMLAANKVQPVTPNPDGVSTTFEVTVSNFNDFIIGNLSLPPFQIVGLPGFTFEIQKLHYDHSELKNPSGIQWPSPNYTNLGNLWQGLYIEKFTLKLPALLNSNASVAVTHAVFDEFGFSGNIAAQNIFGTSEGKLGSKNWPFSIQQLTLKFLHNALTEGGFAGKVQIPIQRADKYLDYSALISYNQGDLNYQFTIQPDSDVEIPVFIAKANLWDDTYLVVKKQGNKLEPTFHLYADVTLNTAFNATLQSIPIKFEGMKFQNIVIDKEGFSLGQNGSISFASEQKKFAGFNISLTEFSIATNSLTFGFDVDLAGQSNVVGGSCSFTIHGQWNQNRLVYQDLQINKLGLYGDVSVVHVEVELEFYNDDPTYGRGFQGSFQVDIRIGDGGLGIGVGCNLLFGNKDDFKYFYIDGTIDNIPAGIPLTMSLNIYGFKGGVYFHMRKENQTYVPDEKTVFGLLAGAAIGLKEKNTFHAKVVLEANFTSSGLGQIGIEGHGYVMTNYQTGFEKYEPAPSVYVGVSVLFDFPKKIFDANMVADINFPAQQPFITGGGGAHMHFEPGKWWIKMGSPETAPGPAPIGLTIIGLLNTESYFMTGHELGTMPPPHPKVAQILGLTQLPNQRKNGWLEGGKGFAFGSSIELKTSLDVVIFYASLEAGAGFDVMVYDGAQCPPQYVPAGLNGWYANGQMYAYFAGDIGLRFRFCKSCKWRKVHLLELQAAALCQMGAPRPFWIDAYVGGYARILGIFEGSFQLNVQYGDRCDFKPQFDPPDPLEGIVFIQDIKPANKAEDVSVFSEPAVLLTFSTKPNETYSLDQEDEEGNVSKRYFKFPLDELTLSIDDPKHPENGKILAAWNGQNLPGWFERDDSGKKFVFKSDYVLPSFTKLKLEVTVGIRELENGTWTTISGYDDQTHKKIVFKTGDEPEKITDDNIDFCVPGRFQRYYLQQDGKYVGYIKTKKQYLKMFDLQGPNPNVPPDRIIVKFIPIDGGKTIEGKFLQYSNNRILFSHPPLANGKMYALQLVKESSPSKWITTPQNQPPAIPANYVTKPDLYSSMTKNQYVLSELSVGKRQHELYRYVFQTSKYNRLGTKVKNLENGTMLKDYDPPFTYPRAVKITAAEPFDKFDKEKLLEIEWDPHGNPWYENYLYPKVYEYWYKLKIHSPHLKNWYYVQPNLRMKIYNPVPLLTQNEIDAKLSEPVNPSGLLGGTFPLNAGLGISPPTPSKYVHYLLYYTEKSGKEHYDLLLSKLFDDHNPDIVLCFTKYQQCNPTIRQMLEYHIQNNAFKRAHPGVYRGLIGYKPMVVNMWDSDDKFSFEWQYPMTIGNFFQFKP